MEEPESGTEIQRSDLDPPNIFLPCLVVLFVASGCSALMYEIIWFQLLRLVVGSSAVSLGVLLGTFMGGMCIGSILLPRMVPPRIHPLLVYAVIELLIGLLGFALLFLIPLIGTIYLTSVGHGMGGILLRAVVASVCLLPPTILMGATLPAISRWVDATREGVAWLGFFYGANIAGAVLGCLLAGFYLLRVYDIATATIVAAMINLGVFAVAVAVSLLAKRDWSKRQEQEAQARSPGERTPVMPYLAIGLSGMCSLGAEVIWTRQLSLLLGASVYTFSIILAVFLTALGIGSGVGSVLARSLQRPRLAFAACQLSVCLAIAWGAYAINQSMPYWPIDPSLASSPWIGFQLDIVRCFWAMFPAAAFWGASFPLAMACVIDRRVDTGRVVGKMYAANTLGAILGAIGFSMLFVSWMGTQAAQQTLIAASAVAASLVLLPLLFESRVSRVATAVSATILAIVTGTFAISMVPDTPTGLIAYGRYLSTWDPDQEPEYIYVGEGMNASIAVSTTAAGVNNFHVSGKVVASSDTADMRLQRMLGHFPALLHERPKSALIVGCGAGVTSGSFLVHPDFERVVICEIEPLIPKAAGEYFQVPNHGVMQDARTEVVFDDARHFIATTDEKFDIITSDPIHPWVKGAAALYSLEYYQLCKARLNDGGFITQWVPLYESNMEAVKSEIATFLEVFPNGTIWGNEVGGRGYDIVMMAQVGDNTIEFDRLEQKLREQEYDAVVDSLRDVDLDSAMKIIARYAADKESLREWLADAQINRDANMRLQYLAGMGLNTYEADLIYDAMVKTRSFPEWLIKADPEDEFTLRILLEPPVRLQNAK